MPASARRPRLDPRLGLLTAAVLFSTGGAAIKAAALTSWQIASFRSGIAAIVVWLLVPRARARWTPRILLVAAVYAATMVLFVAANKLTTSANTIFLQSTAPLYVLLASPLLLGERVTRADLALVAAVAAGMALFFIAPGAPQATAPDPARGNVLAALSGVAWAGTVLGLRWLGRAQPGSTPPTAVEMTDEGAVAAAGPAPALVTVIAGNVLACVACLPAALPVEHLTVASVGVVLYLGVVQIGIAYLALAAAMPYVPALEASTLLLVEPALNPAWAYLVHGERPSTLAWLGGAIILLSALAKTWWDVRRPPRVYSTP
ncbi:MAG: DMT family transporter [Candidatus Eremiobacteraeota bacterium]|nr:DMT family transporter [Candidatus Eremiobacteraeota bacterium]